MTAFQDLLRAIKVRGIAVARAATLRAGAALVAAAVAELPGVTVAATGDDVALSAPGLRARAFGSRRKAADPRVAGLVQR